MGGESKEHKAKAQTVGNKMQRNSSGGMSEGERR
jgi:hypothetical protein